MKHSEMFAYHTLTVRVPTKSKIVPDLVTDEVIGFHCPRCGMQNKNLSHGESIDCVKCDLHMQLYGNGLEATIDL